MKEISCVFVNWQQTIIIKNYCDFETFVSLHVQFQLVRIRLATIHSPNCCPSILIKLVPVCCADFENANLYELLSNVSNDNDQFQFYWSTGLNIAYVPTGN